jgi:hypothetical protein
MNPHAQKTPSCRSGKKEIRRINSPQNPCRLWWGVGACCFLLLFNWFCQNAACVQAVSISVKPKEIALKTKVNQMAEKELLVTNISDEVLVYRVYTDSPQKEIQFLPNNFRLESGENKIVKIQLKGQKTNLTKTQISILAKPLGSSDLTILSGAKINLTYEVLPQEKKLPNEKMLILISIAISIVLLFLSLIFIKK